MNETILLNILHIFPNERDITIDQILKDFSKKDIIEASSTFLSFLNNNSKLENVDEFLYYFFSEENEELAEHIYQKWKKIEKITGLKVRFFNALSSLQLLQFSLKVNKSDIKLSNKEFELKIFKAYLILNYQNGIKLKEAEKINEENNYKSNSPESYLSLTFPYNDFVNFDIHNIVIAQFIKSFYLFEFLNSNQKYQNIVAEVVKYFELPDADTLLNELMKVSLMVADPKVLNEKFVSIRMGKTKEHDKLISFIKKLTLNERTEDANYDFLEIRDAPLFMVEERLFRVLYNLFVVEKMYKSLYFLFSKINKEQNFGFDVKGIFSKSYAEEYLLTKICTNIFDHAEIKLSDSEINQPGSPDFYVRDEESIYIIESKDVLINAETKTSFDIRKYEIEFIKKFYYTMEGGKKHGVGIMQLLKNVKDLLTDNSKYDKLINKSNIKIYPILVLHDRQFESPGFNAIINKWFTLEKLALYNSGVDVSRVRPITVINVDTLIIYQDYFKNQMFNFGLTIDHYFNFNPEKCKMYLELMKKSKIKLKYPLKPFSELLHTIISKVTSLKDPEMFRETTSELINKYNNKNS